MAGLENPDPTLINDDIRPASDEERHWSVFNMASLWIGMVVCVPTYMLAASLIQQGMSWGQAVMTVMLDRQFQLGADAVIGRDQQRIGEARRLQVEETTKAAQIGVGARPACRLGHRADRADQRVARGDRNASIGIGIGRAGFGGR